MKLSNVREVRKFLAGNQPMPDDLDDSYDYDAYGDALNVLAQEPDVESVNLFLASLRRGSDLSVVQGFSSVLGALGQDAVRGLLADHLESGPYDKRGFIAEYVADFPDSAHIPALVTLLTAEGSGGDLALAANSALEAIAEEFPGSNAEEMNQRHFWENPRWAAEVASLKRGEEYTHQLQVKGAEESAAAAFRDGRHTRVVELLQAFEREISGISRKRLSISRKVGESAL